jgi:hypothetical protein
LLTLLSKSRGGGGGGGGGGGIPLATIKYIPIQGSPGRKLKKQLAIELVTCFSRAADAMLEAHVQPKHIKQTSAQQNHQQQI